MMDRGAAISRLRRNHKIQVLIVGGGINGIATFRDLALQGVEVALIERGDYSSGASAASSHMVHGGIRYLENGEFRLVREAVQERNRLIENLPHLVKPIPTVFPIFKIFSGLFNAPLKFAGLLNRPAERGAIVIKLGMLLYDLFTRAQKTVPGHSFRGRRRSLERFPGLNREVLFTGTYYDGTMPMPERICIELIQDAQGHSDHAWAANYVELVGLEDGEVVLEDHETGDKFRVQPELLINASGPWIDFTHRAMGLESGLIGGTKGSHIILDHPELSAAIDGHEFFFENEDGRIVLINPLADKVMIGTTDIRLDNPDEAICTDEEIEYFFGMVGRVFPQIVLDRSQIIFSFSGVRPLPRARVGYTGQISRDHSIEFIAAGTKASFPILALVGGKWTSFRAFSEQATDWVLEHLGQERRISTRGRRWGGSDGYPDAANIEMYLLRIQEGSGLPQDLIHRLFERYGTNLTSFIHLLQQASPDGSLPGYAREELDYLASNEDVVHLDDLVLRRTMLAKMGWLTHEVLSDLGQLVGAARGWQTKQIDQEIERARSLLAARHGVIL